MPTKEERKAKKEAARLEKLRLLNEARKEQRRKQLKREMAIQARKRDELDKTWTQIMLKIKEPTFRQDIEVMWRLFERTYDKKDFLISHIIHLMEVADDQFQRTVASFCDTIDSLINKFLSDLEALSKENDRKTKALLNLGEIDANRIMKDHNAAETHLQLLLYHGHTTADNLAWTTRGENLVKEDEERIKYTNIREDLTSFLENNYNYMWDEYKAVLKAYVTNTADNQKQVRKLRVKENMMADIIASQGKKIASSDGLLKRLRTELAAYESGTKQAIFRDRRNRHREACARLKKCLYNGVDTDVRRMSTLVRVSDEAMEWLQKAQNKCEKILRMAALCRKFETQREKVMPFGSDIPHEPATDKITVRKQLSNDSLVVNAMSSTCGLTRLWQRVSKAELTRRALMREKIILEQENRELVNKINVMNDEKIANPNANPNPNVCTCGPNAEKKSVVNKPVAVECVIEILKYRHR